MKLFFIVSLFSSMLWAQSFEMAVVGDAGKPGKDMDALRESLSMSAHKVLIMPGDNLYSGSYASAWDSWKSLGFQFPIVAIGNHNDGYDQEVEYFGLPGEYYTKAIQGVRFFVLNSDSSSTVAEQFRWLEKEIQIAPEKHIFLVYHHPTFTITKDHFWEEKAQFQKKMRQFLKTYSSRITALLLGHDHISSFVQFGPVTAMIAGSGRTTRSAEPVKYVEDGFEVETIYLAPRTQHWGYIHFESATDKMKAGFYNVKERRTACVIDLGTNQMSNTTNCR